MRTSTLLHHHCHPKTEQDVLQKPLKKQENTQKGPMTLNQKEIKRKIYPHLQTRNILCGMDPHKGIGVCILTLSTSACSSTWSFLVMPVQNKKQKLMHDMLLLLLLPRKVRSSGIWMYYPAMENWPISCCSSKAAGPEERKLPTVWSLFRRD